jgi:hypothetical protein
VVLRTLCFLIWSLLTLTPEQRSLRAQIAANARWSREDGTHQGEILRRGFLKKFIDEVDPDRSLPENERIRRAENALKAHMLRLSLAASKKRQVS